jgi:hypothetical protein
MILASAERCGKNQYLYNFGPICPLEVDQFVTFGRLNILGLEVT